MNEAKEILEGFNTGYIIEKHRPDLTQQLIKAVEGVELPFYEGFKAGAEEYAKERDRTKAINMLRDDKRKPPFLTELDKDIAKDIPDIDKDI